MHDKIWFTYKARIRTQVRLASLDLHSHILLVWYAAVGAFLSIVTISYPTALGEDTALFSAMFGVGVLVMSLLVANRDYRGRSIEMRRNYLALQGLHRKATADPALLTPAEVEEAYQRLLEEAENHSELDDKYARVISAIGLTTRIPSFKEKIEVHGYLAGRVIVLFSLYALPRAIAPKP